MNIDDDQDQGGNSGPESDSDKAKWQRENDRVVYQQRYETFRHFDRLRWQTPAILLGGGSVLIGLSKTTKYGPPAPWALILFGLLCLLSAWFIRKVTAGIKKNHVTLAAVGYRLGDVELRVQQKDLLDNNSGASMLYLWLLFGLGLLGIGLGIASYIVPDLLATPPIPIVR